MVELDVGAVVMADAFEVPVEVGLVSDGVVFPSEMLAVVEEEEPGVSYPNDAS